MKKFDEVNNILVEVSWRFTIVIIIHLAVFFVIFSCLLFAMHSYNKNVELEQQKINIVNKANIEKEVVESGLKDQKILRKNESVDGKKLQKAIDDKNIIIVKDKNEFNNMAGFIPDEYSNDFVGKILLGDTYYFRIKKTFM